MKSVLFLLILFTLSGCVAETQYPTVPYTNHPEITGQSSCQPSVPF